MGCEAILSPQVVFYCVSGGDIALIRFFFTGKVCDPNYAVAQRRIAFLIKKKKKKFKKEMFFCKSWILAGLPTRRSQGDARKTPRLSPSNCDCPLGTLHVPCNQSLWFRDQDLVGSFGRDPET